MGKLKCKGNQLSHLAVDNWQLQEGAPKTWSACDTADQEKKAVLGATPPSLQLSIKQELRCFKKLRLWGSVTVARGHDWTALRPHGDLHL